MGCFFWGGSMGREMVLMGWSDDGFAGVLCLAALRGWGVPVGYGDVWYFCICIYGKTR